MRQVGGRRQTVDGETPAAGPRQLILTRITRTVRSCARIDAVGLAGLLGDLDQKTDAELLAWHDRIQVLADRAWRGDGDVDGRR